MSYPTAEECAVVGIPWIDYARLDYLQRTHRERYIRHVRLMEKPLPCQECCGSGGWTEYVIANSGPWVECGWCEGTGLLTPHLRGQWLRYKRREKI